MPDKVMPLSDEELEQVKAFLAEIPVDLEIPLLTSKIPRRLLATIADLRERLTCGACQYFGGDLGWCLWHTCAADAEDPSCENWRREGKAKND